MEFAATAAEEAAKVNRDLGDTSGSPGAVSEDQGYWEEMGVSTGEELAITLVAGTYSDMHKSVYGRRPRIRFDSYKEVQDAIDSLDRHVQTMIEREELGAQAEAEYQKKQAELQALMPGEYEVGYEKMPQRSGMGRRMENRVIITRGSIRKIIREALR